MSLRAHTEHELAAWLAEPSDSPNHWMALNVLALIDTFATQGHSGSSAPFCLAVFTKLANFEPWTPLQGTDDEWNVTSPGTWQNRRCSHVFRDATGVYDINGRVFREPDGALYTSSDSRVLVTFPYTPHTEYVDVPTKKESPE